MSGNTSSGLSMPDKLAESTRRLEQLVRQIMKESDPAVYDQLAEEIWRVLAERERLLEEQTTSNRKAFPNAA
jgi:hypothetical protein